MLVWGDFWFIPFVFSVQGWFLVNSNSTFSSAVLGGIVSVFVIGFFIFRTCNMQKHVFKHDPKALIWGKTPEGTMHFIRSWGYTNCRVQSSRPPRATCSSAAGGARRATSTISATSSSASPTASRAACAACCLSSIPFT